MPSAIKPARIRGRPKGTGLAQRDHLLRAAEELLDGTASDLNLRQVALRAGVTPPLAHYYFGSRDGLFTALLNERAGPRIEDLLAAATERAAHPVAALTRLMQRLSLTLANDRFVARCLLLPAGAPLRERVRAVLQELLQGAQAAGQLRADLPANYLADALLGLCLFPFLDSDPVHNGGERAAALTLQHVALLQDGIRPRVHPDAASFRGT
jgi:AcrR family transcriptional regulator